MIFRFRLWAWYKIFQLGTKIDPTTVGDYQEKALRRLRIQYKASRFAGAGGHTVLVDREDESGVLILPETEPEDAVVVHPADFGQEYFCGAAYCDDPACTTHGKQAQQEERDAHPTMVIETVHSIHPPDEIGAITPHTDFPTEEQLDSAARDRDWDWRL